MDGFYLFYVAVCVMGIDNDYMCLLIYALRAVFLWCNELILLHSDIFGLRNPVLFVTPQNVSTKITVMPYYM
jgi:hypothetical protein